MKSLHYPVLKDLYRKCALCNLNFWNLNPATTYCGNRECNQADPLQKTCVMDQKKTYAEVFEWFNTYYLKNYAFCDNALRLPRSSTNTKVSSTNMNFICAGISTYETLLDSHNPRLQFFSNRLLISTPFCFRFYDLENVGATKRHNTGFFMFSLHCFESSTKKFPLDWKDQFLQVFVDFFLKSGIALDKMYLHQDQWTDGVNSGQCVEIFINGMEIGNMVFITEKNGQERQLKLLDVGLGGQRIHKLLTGSNVYIEHIILDHLRSLVVAFKDKLYPCKTGPGYCIRKILEYLYGHGYTDLQRIRSLVHQVLKDLQACTKESFEQFYEDFKLISQEEYHRYNKYKNA